MMFKVIVFATVVLLGTTMAQIDVGPCNGRWSTQVRCTKDRVAQRARSDTQFPMPDNGQQNRIKRAIDNCFKQNGCYQSPVPTQQETNARRDCFRQAKRQLDQELNRCVDSRIRGWNPVDDYARIDLDEWGYTVQRIYDSLRNPRDFCGDNRRTQDLRRCVDRDSGFSFSQRPPRNVPNYWCEVDAQCYSDTTPRCQDQWERDVQPNLCQCAKRLGLDRYIAQAAETYRQCINRRVNTDIPDQDPGVGWLSEYVNSMCYNNNNHPCRRERRNFFNRG